MAGMRARIVRSCDARSSLGSEIRWQSIFGGGDKADHDCDWRVLFLFDWFGIGARSCSALFEFGCWECFLCGLVSALVIYHLHLRSIS